MMLQNDGMRHKLGLQPLEYAAQFADSADTVLQRQQRMLSLTEQLRAKASGKPDGKPQTSPNMFQSIDREGSMIPSPVQQSMDINNAVYADSRRNDDDDDFVMDDDSGEYLSKSELKEILKMSEEQYRRMLISENEENMELIEKGNDDIRVMSESEIDAYVMEFVENKMRFENENFENLNWNLKMMKNEQKSGKSENIIYDTIDEMDRRRKILKDQIGGQSTRSFFMQKNAGILKDENSEDTNEKTVENKLKDKDFMSDDDGNEIEGGIIKKRKIKKRK